MTESGTSPNPAPRIRSRSPVEPEAIQSGLDRLMPVSFIGDEQGINPFLLERVEDLDVASLLSVKRNASQRDEHSILCVHHRSSVG